MWTHMVKGWDTGVVWTRLPPGRVQESCGISPSGVGVGGGGGGGGQGSCEVGPAGVM
jgi:hypothetical protein